LVIYTKDLTLSYQKLTNMNITSNTRLGIWGLGVSGQSLIRYWAGKAASIAVLEHREPESPISSLLQQHNCRLYHDPAEREAFFAACDIIIPSPGIDLAQLPPAWRAQCVTELDLFQRAWHASGRSIIAITGTVGKTSTTHLITNLLQQAGIAAVAGGNIGTGMFDLLAKPNITHAVLELSSYQLEQVTSFAPDLAIWTNLYANHLDRHKTVEAYATAKAHIFARQTGKQQALLPLAAREQIESVFAHPAFAFVPFDGQQPTRAWFSATPVAPGTVSEQDHLFYRDATGAIMHQHAGATTCLLAAHEVPTISFPENWVIIAAAATLLGLDAHTVITQAQLSELPHNRLETVATIDGITYINDSKATIIQSTLAAIQSLAPRPVIVLLGGLSKGVDRIPVLPELQKNGTVQHIVCFGAEAAALWAGCRQAGLPATQCATLEEAVTIAHTQALEFQKRALGNSQEPQTQLCVLLSPGGTSFDLFKNYGERGRRFAELAQMLSTTETPS
jgi:UDP-N-acetylmuramoylalanine--D-glutamate ligase